MGGLFGGGGGSSSDQPKEFSPGVSQYLENRWANSAGLSSWKSGEQRQTPAQRPNATGSSTGTPLGSSSRSTVLSDNWGWNFK